MEKRMKIGIVARLKQGDLLQAMRERDWNQRQLAEFLGINEVRLGTLINLKHTPKKFSKKIQKKLMKLTGKLPEDLWPEFVRTKEFLDMPKTRTAFAEITPRFLEAKGLLELPAAPDDIASAKELEEAVKVALETLTPRQELVIRKRFFEGKTLEEVGEDLGVSSERARQIEAKAFRRLRHQSRLRAHLQRRDPP